MVDISGKAAMWKDNRPALLSGLAMLLTLLAALWFVLWPMAYVGVEEVAEGSASAPTVRRIYSSFLEVNGLWGLFVVLAPVALAGLPLLTIRTTGLGHVSTKSLLWLATIALFGFCALGIWSVGLFYLPAAIASLAGTRYKPSART